MAPAPRVPQKLEEVLAAADADVPRFSESALVGDTFDTDVVDVFPSSATASSEERSLLYADAQSRMRGIRSQKSQQVLKEFLQEHRFGSDVSEPRASSCCRLWTKELVYPIHVAAATGDADMVRLLLKHGADAKQKTSLGRTAFDIATEEDRLGSHRDVLELVRGAIRVLSLRDFKRLVR
mmetsp:Transcript_7027/g.16649  ORF Transcript_7027/g.16649 Transcript_7027/m.16649 type:complete len:180 (-) Transcript_7027:73-612(-)|eukprot:s2556_g8.t1